jgi:hypothetical protein
MVTPASLLNVIRVAEQPGYERVVFEFDGLAPAYDVQYVDQVREDPSGKCVPLDGNAFLLVVMPGGTLDTAFQESNPADARSYPGPQRIRPDLRQVKEIAAVGDFEAVLSFGIGVDHMAPFRVLRLADPDRIVVDFATT